MRNESIRDSVTVGRVPPNWQTCPRCRKMFAPENLFDDPIRKGRLCGVCLDAVAAWAKRTNYAG